MSNLALNSKPYRVIKRKRENLEDVIYYESIAKTNDSILRLVRLPEAERVSYFESFIADLKVKAEAEKAKEAVVQRNSGLVTVNNNIGAQPNRVGQQAPSSTFYFYNPTTVAFGKTEFIKIWGARVLEDNWRWSSKGISSVGNVTNSGDILAAASDEERFDPQFYISKIPSAEKDIDSISKDRNYAYYQLGLIYKEKFREYELAKGKFQNLLKSNPEERLILPSKYSLFKIYGLLGENDEASIAKNEIISKYPGSRYATILKNPELVTERDENSPESLYEALYVQHENQGYAEVISKSDDYIKTFDGEPMVPKFELLKATATGRLYGYEAYKKAINYIAVTYANTPEGKQAQNIETNILPKLANTDFVEHTDSISDNYKVVFQFKDPKPEVLSKFKETLDEVLGHIRYYKLKSSIDVYNPNITLVIVHGLKTSQVAKTFNQLLTEEDQKKIKAPYFVVSSTNYQIVQIHKSLDAYLNLDNN
jgi:tetratricopeptide (TPR) repeat protein